MTEKSKPNIPEILFGFLLIIGINILQLNFIIIIVCSFALAIYIAKGIKGLSWKEFRYQLYMEIGL